MQSDNKIIGVTCHMSGNTPPLDRTVLAQEVMIIHGHERKVPAEVKMGRQRQNAF